ncbi:Clp protease N-terminal domain-containing protein [Streptosporangium lutulentum]|uniref:ATP-dependent Clp protease ATP-binding subunit ClpC n=1 Tax=Streptosporangium lutulentum TaxID=1461250 RepID=A0ABT9Q401_9ACTN|nr:Clp protease N-terminal domain-containing protein [Streptosporangium lutulentum]MDP9841175.1 ATP-dependent Clp protease ATP-binding subunit ClpC [Streptosporangium lutulentum]
MPKINVYLPDELAEAVKTAGVPVSAICQRALEQAVRRVTAIRETALSAPDLDLDDLTARFPHFTPRARTVIKLSVEQARALGAAEVGTEHLLGGLLAEGGNLALQVLGVLEIERAEVRHRLDRLSVETPEVPADGDDELTFSASAAAALEMTVTDATALGHNYIGCEHLLLGLIAEPDGAAGQILRGLGAEQRLTRRAVSAALAGYVHLRAQTQASATPPPPPDAASALSAAVREELRPILRRLERLEEHLNPADET